ncbi:MAG: 30S ribosomal protein S1 [Candidatus Omnitrophica bacterium]|nr:30S ribosomal protein S1 [Candidatus Omnitrophota bacterium]
MSGFRESNKREERYKEMSENQSVMAELYESTLKNVKEGEIVSGTIVAVTEKEAVVDIGFKSEGFLSYDEFRDKEEFNVGKEIDVLIESIEDEDGRLLLSKLKADKVKGWQRVMSDIDEGSVIEGRVVKQVKGGYMVDVDGLEGFLPMSLSAFKGYSPDKVLANKFNFQVAKINKLRRNLILSRRDIFQKEREQIREKLWSELEKGQVREGVVKGITDFGAFVDLGSVDGLLHITDMSWSRINHPSEIVSIGDKINVFILDFDKENSKVSLGLKQITANPWEDIYDKYPAGTKVTGKVVNIMPYGVFIEVEKGIEGLLHSSEISWQKKMVNPQEMFKLGDELEVQIINVDKDSKRISLSMKQLGDNPWVDAGGKFPVDTKVTGIVRGFTDYGAFVELDSGLEGMIHVSDMSWTKKVNHPQDVLERGQDVEVMVLGVDAANRKITLGLKQLEENPWGRIAEDYPVNSEVDAEVVLNSNFGVFVKLAEDVEALVYSSEIDKEQAAALKPGDKLKVKIIKVDVEQMKIGVSTRLS